VDGRVQRVAGVVDDDVDLAPGVDRRLDELVGRVALREVPAEDRGLARDLAGGLLGGVLVEVVDDDLAPCSESSSAVARPMPRADPVTMATLSSRTPMCRVS